MATKDFSKMSTKKLQALLETASKEDATLINEVLSTRKNLSAPTTEAEPEPNEPVAETVGTRENLSVPTTEAEPEPNEPVAETVGTPSKSTIKMTSEEAEVLVNDLRANVVNHRCEVVPFNTAEWVNGTVTGIIHEKRSNRILFAVVTDDGRRIVKVIDSKLIKILDEVVEPEKKARGNKAKVIELDENGNPIPAAPEEPWAEEDIKAEIDKYSANVGKVISYPEAGRGGLIEDDAPTVYGRVVSLVPSKRSKSILYRILVDGTLDKFTHKVATSANLTIADELDDEGKKINEAYINRLNREPKQKVSLTVAEKLETLKSSLAKAELKAEEWAKIVEQRKAKLIEFEEANKDAIAESFVESSSQEVEVTEMNETSVVEDELA